MKRLMALIVTISILSTPIANAHTAMVSSSPKKNAVLATSPKYISITFTEDLIEIAGKQISKIELFNAKGKAIPIPKAQVIHRDIVAAVSSLPSGKYKVVYRVVSNDGHPVSGSYFFTIK